jgi:hypothetical protein
MDEGETIRQLRELVEQLKHEVELLRAKVIELEARLAQYENAHTPPSLRRGRNRKKDREKDIKGKPGQKSGHKGVTRTYVAPDRQVEVTMDCCPDCGTKLGSPFRIDSKIIEEIPEPQPIIVADNNANSHGNQSQHRFETCSISSDPLFYEIWQWQVNF